MKTLIIETSSEKSCLILAENGLLKLFQPLPGGPELSQKLALETDRLLAHTKPDLIAIGTGPGSYTGIRVGAALAKALAYGWNIPLMGFCSLKAFLPIENGPFAVLADARMGGIYTLIGERQGDKFSFEKPALLAPNAPLPLNLCSPHPDLIEKRTSLKPTFSLNPNLLAHLVYQQFLECGTTPLELTYLTNP